MGQQWVFCFSGWLCCGYEREPQTLVTGATCNVVFRQTGVDPAEASRKRPDPSSSLSGFVSGANAEPSLSAVATSLLGSSCYIFLHFLTSWAWGKIVTSVASSGLHESVAIVVAVYPAWRPTESCAATQMGSNEVLIWKKDVGLFSNKTIFVILFIMSWCHLFDDISFCQLVFFFFFGGEVHLCGSKMMSPLLFNREKKMVAKFHSLWQNFQILQFGSTLTFGCPCKLACLCFVNICYSVKGKM